VASHFAGCYLRPEMISFLMHCPTDYDVLFCCELPTAIIIIIIIVIIAE